MTSSETNRRRELVDRLLGVRSLGHEFEDTVVLRSQRATGAPAQGPILMTIGDAWLPPPSGLIERLAHQDGVSHGYQFSAWGEPLLLSTLEELLPASERWPDGATLSTAVSWHGTRAVLADLARSLLSRRTRSSGQPAIVVTAPGYDHASPFEALGFKTVNVALRPENGFAPTADDVANSLALADSADLEILAIVICPQHSPTGRNWSPEDVACFADLADRTGAVLVVDNAYFGVMEPEARCTSGVAVALEAGLPANQVLLVRSLGKAYSCNAWALGGIAGGRDLVEDIVLRVRPARSYSSHGFLQRAMAEWLMSPGAGEFQESRRHHLSENRRLARRAIESEPDLRRWGRSFIGGATPFLLLEVPARWRRSPQAVESFVRELFSATAVLVTTAQTVAPAGLNPTFLPWLRLYLGLPRADLVEAFDRVSGSGLS